MIKLHFKLYLADSLQFTKKTFNGDWIRGGIFLLLCLFLAASSSVNFLPRSSSGGLIWPIAPWWGSIITLIIWLFVEVITTGYCIRIFRGDTEPPSFTPAGALIKDGFVTQIALLVWAIPIIICESISLVLHTFYLVPILEVLWIILFFVAPPIYFIYANTGAFSKCIRPSKILSVIRTPGLGSYIVTWAIAAFILLVTLFISFFLNFILVHILPIRFNPATNFVIFGFVFPILVIFIARLFTNVFLNRNMEDLSDTLEFIYKTR